MKRDSSLKLAVQISAQQTIQLNRTISEQSAHLVQILPPKEGDLNAYVMSSHSLIPPSSEVIIRRYASGDRDKVRQLCCETGFLGRDIAPVFEDRELFADYLTRYYTDIEPESSFVLEHRGIIKGYLLGSRFPLRQQIFSFFNNMRLFLRGMSRYPRYSRPTRDFIGWILRNSWKEVPAAPRRSAHFHFNILPEAQGLAHSTALMNAYLDYLRDVGVTSVYGQVVTFETRRGARVFERYGFQVIERREITKYRNIYPEAVYLTTVLMKLSPRDVR